MDIEKFVSQSDLNASSKLETVLDKTKEWHKVKQKEPCSKITTMKIFAQIENYLLK